MITPPILLLPEEILVAIAAAGQDNNRHILEWNSGNRFKVEWALSRVSRQIRAAIIDAATLWTIVDTELCRRGWLEILGLYLERSRGCDLSATFRCNADRSMPRTWLQLALMLMRLLPQLGRFFRLLPHLPRLSRLTLIGSTPTSLHMLFSVFLNLAAMPNLQQLEIVLDSVDPQHQSRVTLDAFCTTPPKLASLRTKGFIPYHPRQTLMAFLTNLEVWRDEGLGNLPADWFEELVSGCPLVRVSVPSTWLSPTGHGRVCIPTLKSLHISCRGREGGTDWLDSLQYFDAPALTNVTLDHTHGTQICALFNPGNLPDEPFPALTSLSFLHHRCTCSEGWRGTNLSPPLNLFPALSSISLINQCFTADVVRAMFNPASPRWSGLTNVTLVPRDALEDVFSALEDAVHSNLERGQTLPKLTLSPALFDRQFWTENRVDVELFGPMDVIFESFPFNSCT
ncbi:hypothetical protein B0H16DRAFT_1895539 [Mycena metata]|uniref:F-box domain-containing protein n=1 Tax=Mycena metata TaxID=1033252 RepID=A0AAD7HP30_9AGAR|nr:hypothetical protein B0H16DRAFT_1895539 [Mycena metata]